MHAVFNEGKPVFQVNKHDIFKSFSRQLDQVGGVFLSSFNMLQKYKSLDHVDILWVAHIYGIYQLIVTLNALPDLGS